MPVYCDHCGAPISMPPSQWASRQCHMAKMNAEHRKTNGRHTHRILGRPGEVVHHINGDKRPENLQAEHARWHKEKEVVPDEVHPTRISAEGDRQDRQQ